MANAPQDADASSPLDSSQAPGQSVPVPPVPTSARDAFESGLEYVALGVLGNVMLHTMEAHPFRFANCVSYLYTGILSLLTYRSTVYGKYRQTKAADDAAADKAA